MGRSRWAIAAMLAPALAAATALAADAEVLRGDRFINVMRNNTLTGETEGGARFDVYFLPGGLVTYRDAAGADDRGQWRIDRDGDVCITWASLEPGKEECFRVTLDGSRVSWEGKTGSGEGTLRGTITDGNLAARSG
jgi:hypothetical protein